MPVFVVIARREIEGIRERVEQMPDGSYYELTRHSWLIDYEGTTRSLAETLGFRAGDKDIEGSSAIAFPISNYAGRWQTDVWEWLKLHLYKKED
jgi:hypothetical protein